MKYKINLDTLETAVEEYKKNGDKLEENKEALQKFKDDITQEVWSGDDAEAFREAFQVWLNKDYQDTIDQVREMEGGLRYALKEGKNLKAFCDMLPNTLDGIPISYTTGSEADGILYLDTDQLPVLKESARLVAENAREMCSLANEIDEILEGLETIHFDVKGYTDSLRGSCRRLENVELFSDALEEYGEYMEFYDEYLANWFRPFADLTEDHSGRYRTYEADGSISQERMAYLLSLDREHMTEMELSELKAMENGLYAQKDMEKVQALTESILQKDAARWSDTEAAFAARVWESYLETEDVEGIQWFLGQLQCAEYGERTQTFTGPMSGYQTNIPVTYKFSTEKCELLMGQMDPFTQGEAYYTMNRVMHFHNTRTLSYLYPPEEVPNYLTLEVTKGEEGIILCIQVDPPGICNTQTERLRVCDINEEVGTEGIANLRELGFTKEQIVSLFRDAYTNSDVEFISRLSNAREAEDYAEVCKIDPNSLSIYMNSGFCNYAYILMDQGLEVASDGTITGQNLEQYATFLNGVLYCQQFDVVDLDGISYYTQEVGINYTEEYLAILVGETECTLDTISAVLYAGYNQEEVVKAEVPAMQKQVAALSLYEALYYYRTKEIYCDLTWPNCYQIENLTFQGNDLMNGGNTSCFEVTLRESLVDYEEPTVINTHVLTPNQTEQRAERDDYIEKVKAAHWAIPKELGQLAIEGISIAVPEVGLGISALEAVSDVSKLGTPISGAIKEYSDNDSLKNAATMGKTAYAGIWNVVKAYREKEQAYQEILDDWYQDSMTVNGNGKDVILSKGQYLPNTIMKKAYFENEGLCFMFGTQEEGIESFRKSVKEVDLKVVKKLNDAYFKGVNEDTKLDMLSLVWCGVPYHEDCRLTLSDMTDDQIDECVEKLGYAKVLIGSNSMDLDLMYKMYIITYLR